MVVPRSGQPWNPAFLQGERLFAPFEWLAAQLRGVDWPTPEALTELGEAARLRTAEPLVPLSFRTMVPLGRRRKKGPVRLAATYDGSIAEQGEVPCLSASYHDLFNAIAFAAFPRSKRALHARQYRALVRSVPDGAAQLPGARTRERDALTIFDEGGMVVAMTAERARAHRERSAPVRVDAELGCGLEIVTFGHALLEHFNDDHDYSRSSGVVVVLPDDAFSSPERLLDHIDVLVAARLGDEAEFREPGADAIVEVILGDGASPKRGEGIWLGPFKAWAVTLPDAPLLRADRLAGRGGLGANELADAQGARVEANSPEECGEAAAQVDTRSDARHLRAPS